MTVPAASTTDATLVARVATELSLNPQQVQRTLTLFAEGATLPFIARYRKEITGGLDEVQLRDVRERAEYLTELEDRRAAILKSIDEQGKLDDVLKAGILAADTKQALEDLYLPYKPKRRTRAMIARERGLAPLAESLWDGSLTDATAAAKAAEFVLPEVDGKPSEVPTADAALQGARDIISEQVAEDAVVRGWVREVTRAKGVVKSTVLAEKKSDESKFKDYFEFSESLGTIPSHRMLAIRRGETEGELLWRVEAPVDEINARLAGEVIGSRKATQQLTLVAADAYKRLLAPAIEVELRVELKTRADDEAITIFGRNLEQLLLASPAGEKRVIGLDPGFRTGVKVAVVSATGALVHTDTLYLHQEDRFAGAVRAMIERFKPELIAIGNGTASRETETLTKAALREMDAPRPQVVVVNEAGASVYSASDLARAEFPELDVSLRGAVSIARRLQDPLAELVKIDPKSIGVGQYQHDVNQSRLKQRLDDTVESAVNRVGVEVNTASAALLGYVAGIGPSLAQAIVTLRDSKGGFKSRGDLKDVPRLGAKAFEQSAGFLRVRGGAHPLDSSAVHPERYALVERMAKDLSVNVTEFLGTDTLVDRIELTKYVSDDVGMPTLRDIVAELKKPGRDPRAAFEPPAFREDIQKPSDLLPGMVLEGVVTNIVAFGAFVDIGVHQDGLVHVSQLSDRYIKDANDVVKVGQKVKVTVQNVDLPRNRIALSMRSDGGTSGARAGAAGEGGTRRDVQDNNRNTRDGGRDGGRPANRGSTRPAAPAAKPFVPTKGSVAPNGIRFK
ncbi:MAG TPA: RNA-binding transcriptional accessory protein [Gemmatimonas aurantiaca]|uniref:Transcription accessory protein n=2 Tax=Gemmatimonas aurantiaca TaxID=173480 RepID=C1A3I1_GEMAT|nr:Tex family protein [Gemmatimonas aurantiaca]BAH37058.1 transcription accessory protein [Gemmatimonas aurantiaca T-27]HCT58911.1 RNA-binding transcriptional accessory protein [Gemmatimonas aurantiaca]